MGPGKKNEVMTAKKEGHGVPCPYEKKPEITLC
jgi:hypothetical protein